MLEVSTKSQGQEPLTFLFCGSEVGTFGTSALGKAKIAAKPHVCVSTSLENESVPTVGNVSGAHFPLCWTMMFKSKPVITY